MSSLPTAALAAANVGVGGYGQTSYEFTVTYSGSLGIRAASVAGAVVQVMPPSGLGGPITATVVSTVNGTTNPSSGDPETITVTYKITPPGGSWTTADDGTYTISLGGQPITDSQGQAVSTGTLGTFAVNTGKIAITKYGLIRNLKTNTWSGTIKLTNTGPMAFSGPIFVLFNLPAGRRPRGRHRHLRRDAVPGGQRRQPGGRRDHQRHRHVQLQCRRRQLFDVV